MTVRVILACAALSGLVSVPAAWAGPWAREAGQAFVSVTREQDRAGNAHTGLYAEYGLTRRRTLGVEIGYTDVGETTAMLWYQRSLDKETGPNRLSWSMGIGAIRRDGRVLPSSRIALMWGRGLQGPWEGGWLTAEGRITVSGKAESLRTRQGLTGVEYAYLTPEVVTKLDLTWGLRPSPAWAVVNQLRVEAARDRDLSARLATSLVRDVPGPAQIEAGVIAPLAGPGEPALKIGTWLEF
ncbi:hypothetical protein EYE42_12415 [Paracoccus subflavus]|uniref:DUF481 domain-containing protein n=1 Tax=Paracoccus subflavus TaxID=2528244 RepID=A0A4Q9G0Y6_9RHOB|nr:hypothetical protein [Paracoccus subflavus]TBN38689.1 hypothetical protein EYE42_12415 [Paracoccus subflavus]